MWEISNKVKNKEKEYIITVMVDNGVESGRITDKMVMASI